MGGEVIVTNTDTIGLGLHLHTISLHMLAYLVTTHRLALGNKHIRELRDI